jgi:hypothetical protein
MAGDAVAAAYVTADALRSRLRAHGGGVRLSGGRAELLQRCGEHGLVTDYERLATRRADATREAWLRHELALAGCALRSDSRLCEAYIRAGVGDPREIAGVMAEMRFFHEHTRYESIRDRHRRGAEEEYERELDAYERDRDRGYADRDLRPRFRDFYCPEDASDSGKAEALAAWVRDHAGDSAETACEHPTLPPTLRRSLLHRVADERFAAWFEACFRARAEGEEARIALPHLRAEGLRLADANFDAWFGAKIGKHRVLVRARARVALAVDIAIATKGMRPTDPAASHIRRVATEALRAGLTSGRVISAVKDAALKHIAAATSPPAAELVTFAEAVDRTYGRGAEPSASERKRKRARMQGRWRCTRCRRYVGSEQGVWDHSRRAHGVGQMRDVEAVMERDDSASATIAPLTAEAFRVLVARALRKNGAARTIQAHWRNAIANPEFEVCRRRLKKEAAEL